MDMLNRLLVVYSPRSTNANYFERKIRPQLMELDYEVHFLTINNLPYFEARKKIADSILDGDTILAAGGDGIANVSLDGAMESGQNTTLAVAPLGNFNDFARSIDGSVNDVGKILKSDTFNFRPLDLSVNRHHLLYVAQYISFGITAHLTDYLNSDKTRDLRRRLRLSSTMFGVVSALNYNKIIHSLSDISLPTPKRNGRIITDNSLGFLLGPIGHYFGPAMGSYHQSDSQFWFHHAKIIGRASHDVPYISSWFGRNLPGVETDYEELTFAEPSKIVAQVSGDKLELNDVSEISCQRSQQSIRIHSPRLAKSTKYLS